MKGLKNLATQLGLRQPDEGEVAPTPPASVVPTPQGTGPALSVVSAAPSFPAPPYGGADAAMVQSIKDAVLKSSGVLTAFTTNCEVMRKAFPNDESARMKAALAMMGTVDKAVLLGEMQKTVAASLLHAKNSAEEDRKAARDTAVGTLERELKTVSDDIASTQTKVTELQRQITEKQTRAVALQGEVRTAESTLQQKDSVVKASFAEVERYLATLTQTFTQL